MSSTTDVLAALDAAVQALGGLDWDAVPTRGRLEALDRLETVRRRATAAALDLVGSVDRSRDPALGRATARIIADVVRITPTEARRRIRDASQLQSRTSLDGQVLPPPLPATAKAWDAGLLDPEHLRTIQKFLKDLPVDIHPAEVDRAETFLADKATVLRPDQLEKVADRLAIKLNPDGHFSDEYRATHRGFTWCGRQRPDGMSIGRLVATPELRAMLDAVMAKLAAPGMCNPADHTPTVSGEPTQDAADRDARTHPQRQHDGLAAVLRGQLGDPKLGQHNGLPVTVIVSTTLDQLHTGAGVAVTGGGSLLPMRDVIRMASHAYHYLCVFDKHTERALYLGRSKRIASADQRVVLHGKERGCSFPGCDMPGYLSEVHHCDEWAEGGQTNINDLTFGCGQHHALVTTGGWTTRKRPDGTTEWIPPPQIPLPGGTNDYHHPERLLPEE